MARSRKTKDIETELAISELAYQVAQGLELGKAAAVCNLDPLFATQLAATEQFEQRLKAINPEYYKIWQESQQEEALTASVRAEARKDGKMFYNRMKKLVSSGKLPEKDEAVILEKLLRLGGYFRDEEVREVVTLAPGHVATILEASKESDMSPDEWPWPLPDETVS